MHLSSYNYRPLSGDQKQIFELDLTVSWGVKWSIAPIFSEDKPVHKEDRGHGFRDPTSVGICEVPAVHIAVTRCI